VFRLAVVMGALLLDRWLGEPQRWHPLERFGALALAAERRLYRHSRRRGVLLLCLLVLPGVGIAGVLTWAPYAWVLELFLLYLAIGGRSLGEHARAVAAALGDADLPLARRRVTALVSRDSEAMDAAAVSMATVESVLENGNDAVTAALFWYLVAGAPGVIGYRLVNTLDAMWGYRTERYARFGWAAARLDDLLNWVPARLTALAYALAGDTRHAFACWLFQARAWKSPNAGPVMAAGAGALSVRLGGAAVYHGCIEQRPVLGLGRVATADDIEASIGLLERAVWLFVLAAGVITLGATLFWGLL